MKTLLLLCFFLVGCSDEMIITASPQRTDAPAFEHDFKGDWYKGSVHYKLKQENQ